MEITSLIKELDIGKWSAAWAFLTGGWAGLAKLICEAFTKLLKKADADKLAKYAELAENIAQFIRYGINLFVTDEKLRNAIGAVATAVEQIAVHIKDGEYTPDEMDADIDAIEAAIDAWKEAKMKAWPKDNVFTLVLAAIFTMSALSFLMGCKTYYENAGMRVRAGSITAPIELSEPTSSTNIRLLFFLDGVDLYATKGSAVEMRYYTANGGSFLTSATTQAVEVAVTPWPTNGVKSVVNGNPSKE